jgi:hypothetical protein
VLHAQQLTHRILREGPVEYERAHALQEQRAQVAVAPHGARLQQREPFPGRAARLVVALDRGQRRGDRARTALGPQPQVHAVHDAFGGGFGERGGDAPPQLHREIGLARRVCAAAYAAAVGRVDVDEVDVGAEVQLAATELAEAEHREARAREGGGQRR